MSGIKLCFICGRKVVGYAYPLPEYIAKTINKEYRYTCEECFSKLKEACCL